jgi:hypothetical protein
MMPAMRIVTALLAAAALSCASRQSVPTCIDLSGTYKLTGQPTRQGTGSTAFVFGEGAVLNKVEALTITQPGCRIELHATGDGGKVHDAVLENDLSWTEDSPTSSGEAAIGTGISACAIPTALTSVSAPNIRRLIVVLPFLISRAVRLRPSS